MINTVAVIVTYSNRFRILERVLRACVDEGVDKIIVVDNNSEESSKRQLLQCQKSSGYPLEVIWNIRNEGSAKGYKQGLERACQQSENDFIWLLDDDNKPLKDSLKNLKEFWRDKPEKVVSLLSYRPDRKQYKEAVYYDNPSHVLGWKDSFYGFHVLQKLLRPFHRAKQTERGYGPIAYAPFGGMFFHKSLIDEIGYPDEELFLYSDDHDWSYRITEKGKEIYLVLNSLVVDIDKSWNVPDQKGSKPTGFERLCLGSRFRVYYTIRNRMVFEQRHLVHNKIIYRINRLFFTVMLFAFCGNSEVYQTCIKAIKDAKRNKLGQNYADFNS